MALKAVHKVDPIKCAALENAELHPTAHVAFFFTALLAKNGFLAVLFAGFYLERQH